MILCMMWGDDTPTHDAVDNTRCNDVSYYLTLLTLFTFLYISDKWKNVHESVNDI